MFMNYAAHTRLITILLFSVVFQACAPDTATVDYTAKELRKKDSLENQLVTVDGKKPLRLLTERPYNLETPLKYFLEDITPNDVFFIRWHLPVPPEAINEDTFRLRITGNTTRTLALSMNDLRTKFTPHKTIAVCACAGNARNTFNPRIPGAQWGNGGMGNAEWTGVKLKDILAMAGAKPNSKFVSFNGLDKPVFPTTPDFVKSLEYAHAMDGEVMIAYAMNGEPLPLLNGYPLKLVVPGWYATYWVGMLSDITLHADTFHNFWMDKAYKIPKDAANGNESPDNLAKDLVPIKKMDVRSLFIWPEPGSNIKTGEACEIQGLAIDDGTGITQVDISTDKGKNWTATKLDPVLGKYSWRRWRYTFTPTTKGNATFWVKATNAEGTTQPWQQWNRGGYMRNKIDSLTLNIMP